MLYERVSRYVSNAFGLMLVSSFFFGTCEIKRPNPQAANVSNRDLEYALNNQQIDFIRDSVPKLLVWEAFWFGSSYASGGSGVDRKIYQENVGKPFPVKLISLEGAVVILIPLLHTAVTYVEMPGGRLDFPSITAWGDILEIRDDDTGIRNTLKASLGWSIFLRCLERGQIVGLTAQQTATYVGLLSKQMTYSEINSTIVLLRLVPPVYDPMNDTKRLLLERIQETAIEQAETMFEMGDDVIISVPDFNVGDPLISILMESKQNSAMLVDLQLNTNPKDEPVSFVVAKMFETGVGSNGPNDHTPERIRTYTRVRLKHRIRVKSP